MCVMTTYRADEFLISIEYLAGTIAIVDDKIDLPTSQRPRPPITTGTDDWAHEIRIARSKCSRFLASRIGNVYAHAGDHSR